MHTANPTIFITGGHITPALALMEEIRTQYPSWNMMCVGRNIAIEGSKEQSVEKRLVTDAGAIFLPITAGRLSRTVQVSSVVALLKTPVGFFQALRYCRIYRPAVVVSFGGYVALPVALAAYLLRIPVVTHEQTRVMGLANRIITNVARKICVTFEDQKEMFPKEKTVVTGLPLRNELFHPPSVSPFSITEKKPVIYITGGSTGAVSLNDALFEAINSLTQSYILIHQTGKLSLQKALDLRATLPAAQQKRYIVGDFFDTHAIAWILRHADLMIGRSGANTIMEAAVFGKRMICIPLPWSAGGEQLANAQWLATHGLGRVIEQKNMNMHQLIAQVGDLVDETSTKKLSLSFPVDGAKQLLAVVNDILGK